MPFSKKVENIAPSGIRKFFDLVQQTENIISLGVGEPDFDTPWSVRQAAIKSIENGLTSYTSNLGFLELRKKIATYLEKKFNLDYAPESEILITNGVSEAVDIVLRALLNPGDEVLLPEPSYVCYDPLIALTGAVPVSIPTENTQFIPDPEIIKSKITPKTKAIILCTPNNPTGSIIPKETLEKIANLAKDHGFWVISDEIYAELSFDCPFTSIGSLPNMKERTVILNGFSKTYAMTGWRVGYIACPSPLLNLCVKIHQYAALCASTTAQYAAMAALDLPQKEIDAMIESYQQRRTLMINKFNKIGLTCQNSQGALYAFPSIKITPFTSEEFAANLLQEMRVAVVPGTAFGKRGEGYIRCCYATGLDDLIIALDRIEEFVRKYKA